MVCKNHNYSDNKKLKKIKYLKNFSIDWKKNTASCLISGKKDVNWKEYVICEKDSYKFKLSLGQFFMMVLLKEIIPEKESELEKVTKLVSDKLKNVYEWKWRDPDNSKYVEYGKPFIESYNRDLKRKKVYNDSFCLEVCLYYYLFFTNKSVDYCIKNFFDMKYPKSKAVILSKEDKNIKSFHSEGIGFPNDSIFYIKNDKVVKFKKGLNVCGNYKDGVIVAQNIKKDFPNTGLIDINENEILPFEYHDIFPFNAHVKGNLALVTSENVKLGLINSDGKFILPCIFDEIVQVKKGYVKVSIVGASKPIVLKIG